MRVTIIPSDTFCAVDDVGYFDVDMSSLAKDIHAVQWFGVKGWIEFGFDEFGVKKPNQEIDSLDFAQGVLDSWSLINYEHNNPPPPPPPTAEYNKAVAEQKLTDTDWTQLPSVSNPLESNPYLLNAAEFATYRNLIRDIARNPVAGNIDWPVAPINKWSQT